MRFLLLVILIVGSPLVAYSQGAHYDNSPGDLTGGGTISGELDLICSSCPSLIYQPARASDAAAYTLEIHAGDAYAQGAGANAYGGDLFLRGGIGARRLTGFDITKLAGGNDIITVIRYIPGTGVVSTSLTATTSFACAGSNDACATAAAAAIDALTGVSAVATTSNVDVYADDSTMSVALSVADGGVDGAFATPVNSQNGSILAASGTETIPAIGFTGSATTGISYSDAYKLVLSYAGTRKVWVNADGLNATYVYAPIIEAGVTSGFGVFSLSKLITGTDGTWTMTNNAKTDFLRLRFGTATAADPMLNVNGAGLEAKLADNSAFTTFAASSFIGGTEADLTAGACTAGLHITDTGTTREWCHCNAAGTAYDCITIEAIPRGSSNGPVD